MFLSGSCLISTINVSFITSDIKLNAILSIISSGKLAKHVVVSFRVRQQSVAAVTIPVASFSHSRIGTMRTMQPRISEKGPTPCTKDSDYSTWSAAEIILLKLQRFRSCPSPIRNKKIEHTCYTNGRINNRNLIKQMWRGAHVQFRGWMFRTRRVTYKPTWTWRWIVLCSTFRDVSALCKPWPGTSTIFDKKRTPVLNCFPVTVLRRQRPQTCSLAVRTRSMDRKNQKRRWFAFPLLLWRLLSPGRSPGQGPQGKITCWLAVSSAPVFTLWCHSICQPGVRRSIQSIMLSKQPRFFFQQAAWDRSWMANMRLVQANLRRSGLPYSTNRTPPFSQRRLIFLSNFSPENWKWFAPVLRWIKIKKPRVHKKYLEAQKRNVHSQKKKAMPSKTACFDLIFQHNVPHRCTNDPWGSTSLWFVWSQLNCSHS